VVGYRDTRPQQVAQVTPSYDAHSASKCQKRKHRSASTISVGKRDQSMRISDLLGGEDFPENPFMGALEKRAAGLAPYSPMPP
jgi:hypothetical protein